MQMKTLFSREWFTDFAGELNRDATYENLAKEWEGDILFIINGDSSSTSLRWGESMLARLDLFHGKCRKLDFPDSADGTVSQYRIEGDASDWEAIMKGNADLISSIMKGVVKVEGNLMKLMKYLPAAEEIVRCARRVTSP